MATRRRYSAAARRRQLRLVLALERDAAARTKIFQRRMVVHFKTLGRMVADAYKASGAGDFSDLVPTKTSLPPLDVAHITTVLDRLNISSWQSKVIGAEYARQYREVAHATYDHIGSAYALSIGGRDTVSEQVVREGGRRLGLVDLDKQTRRNLFSAVEDARAQGFGADKTAALVEQIVTNGGRFASVEARARVIARTEIAHAQRKAVLASYDVSGAFDTVIVYDGRLDTSDQECIDRDGLEVTFAEAEELMDDEHPNGTLSFAPGSVRE